MIFLLCLLVLQILEIASVELQPRVVKGNLSKKNQFPYLVGIKIQNGLSSLWCGGNIISNKWILTAAHCFDRWKPWHKGFIYYGSKDREEGTKISFKYSDVVKHPKYAALKNDLALIKTVQIRFSNYTKAIALPSSKEKGESYANQWAIAAGWNRKLSHERLMWTFVKIASASECPKRYSIEGELPLCGRVKPGSSICDGDSGGPLMQPQKRTLVGVISFIRKGSNCDNGELVGFANVVNYLQWISDVSGVKPT